MGRTANKWVILILCWIIWGFIASDRMLLTYVAPALIPDMKISMTEFGLAMSVLTITWAIMAGIAGYISDVIGRVRVITIAGLLFSATTWLTGIVRNFGQLLGVRALVGIGEGSYWGPGVSIINRAWPKERRGFALGFHQSGFPVLGVLVAGSLTGWLTSIYGWRVPFYVYGVAGIIVTIIFYALVKEPETEITFPDPKDTEKLDVKALFKSRNFIVNLVIMSLWMIVYWSIATFLPVYLTNVKGLTISFAGFMAGFTGLIGFVGMWSAGAYSDNIGRKPALAIAFICALVGIPLLVMTGSFLALAIALILVGYGLYAVYPLTLASIPADVAPPILVGTAAGITMLVSEVVGILGPILGGYFNDIYGLGASFWLAFGIAIVNLIILSLVMEETAPKKRPVRE